MDKRSWSKRETKKDGPTSFSGGVSEKKKRTSPGKGGKEKIQEIGVNKKSEGGGLVAGKRLE